MKQDHSQPPTTVKEVGIHVGYLREDITEVKDLLRQHIELAATKAEVNRLETEVEAIKSREPSYVTTKQLWGTVGGVGVLITLVISAWNLIDKIRGL